MSALSALPALRHRPFRLAFGDRQIHVRLKWWTQPSVAAVALFSLVGLIILWPILGAPFGAADDHQIAASLGADRTLPFIDVPRQVAVWISGDGSRFRPVYWTLRTVETAIWGDNMTAWHVARLGLAVLGALPLVLLLRKRVPTLALVLLPLLLWSGPWAEIWAWVAPNEAYALPLLLWGLVVWRRWPWVGVALILLAGMTKESFAVFDLFVAGWLLYRDRSRPAAALVAGSALTAAMVAAVFILGGDVHDRGRTLASVAGTAGGFTWGLLVATGIFVPLALALIGPRWETFRRTLLLAVVVVGAQVMVAGSEGIWVQGRYLVPALLAAIAVAVVALAGMPSSGRAYRLSMAAIAVALLIGIPQQQGMARERAAQADSFDQIVQQVIAWRGNHPDGQLVLTPSRGFDYEWYKALRRTLILDGSHLEPAVMVEPPAAPSEPFEAHQQSLLAIDVAPIGEPAPGCLAVGTSAATCDGLVRLYLR